LFRQNTETRLTRVQEKHPFKCDAICLVPEHIYYLWALPENDANYSIRWASIKALFSKYYLQAGGGEGNRSTSRQTKGEFLTYSS